MDYRIKGLAPEPFAPLFAMTDEELSRHRARRCIADARPGFPCRVSLEDAHEGEEVLLVNYEHHSADTPYRASHAIYVSRGADKAFDAANVTPGALRSRLLSVRAFDGCGYMVDADIIQGEELPALIERFFGDGRVAYLHAHFARRGCFAARIERA